MAHLSAKDMNNLRKDLRNIEGSSLVGVLVGDGSMILNFSNNASILIQCAFETNDGEVVEGGHGEISQTAIYLFKFLNTRLDDVAVTEAGLITLGFGPDRRVRIIPDGSGLESYVLRTSSGVFPVS
ncbi:MAG TPA: hypothetical protein VNF04_11395 [Stellaceae bacterium]|nr:hypothetical protein [Stellaceae bacterium]